MLTKIIESTASQRARVHVHLTACADGATTAEIAQALGIDAGSVASRLRELVTRKLVQPAGTTRARRWLATTPGE